MLSESAKRRRRLKRRWVAALKARLRELLPGAALWGPRFEPLFDTSRRCAGKLGSEFKRVDLGRHGERWWTCRRWCRRRAVVRTGGKWWCTRCLRHQPLPLWEGAEELHMRPVAWPGLCYDSLTGHPRDDERARELVGQYEAQRLLGCTPDRLWEHMLEGRLPRAYGYQGEPYRFFRHTVEALRERLATDAAERLGHR